MSTWDVKKNSVKDYQIASGTVFFFLFRVMDSFEYLFIDLIISEYLLCDKHSRHPGNRAKIAALVELMFWRKGNRQ